MRGSALGLIETYGFLGAVEAADTALKAAEVELLGLTKVKGGLVTITLTGEVAAMIAAVDAATASVERLGVHRSSHVIPRLDEEVWGIVDHRREETPGDKDPPPKGPEPAAPRPPGNQGGGASKERSAPQKASEKKGPKSKATDRSRELAAMKVVELRRLARSIDGLGIPKGEIKYANKETLLEALLKHEEGRRKE